MTDDGTARGGEPGCVGPCEKPCGDRSCDYCYPQPDPVEPCPTTHDAFVKKYGSKSAMRAQHEQPQSMSPSRLRSWKQLNDVVERAMDCHDPESGAEMIDAYLAVFKDEVLG